MKRKKKRFCESCLFEWWLLLWVQRRERNASFVVSLDEFMVVLRHRASIRYHWNKLILFFRCIFFLLLWQSSMSSTTSYAFDALASKNQCDFFIVRWRKLNIHEESKADFYLENIWIDSSWSMTTLSLTADACSGPLISHAVCARYRPNEPWNIFCSLQ